MKVLLDTCVWGGARAVLEAAGHDVIWVGDWSQDPGDQEILGRAHDEQRVLATLDKDFGELAVLQRLPHSGIVRLVGLRARQQGPSLSQVLRIYASELAAGALITVEPGRVRIRQRVGD